MNRWFNPLDARPVPVIERPPAGMVVQEWCDACKRYRAPSELERGRRSGVDLVICRAPRECIVAAQAAHLWLGEAS